MEDKENERKKNEKRGLKEYSCIKLKFYTERAAVKYVFMFFY